MEYTPVKPRKMLQGQHFNSWHVIELLGKKNGHIYWLSKCQCGHVQAVEQYNLTSGRHKQCQGCRADQVASWVTTHGKSKTTEYRTWQAMKTRCHNPRSKWFPYWGGRGIKVCEEWRNSFEAFLAHIGPKPHKRLSIDRIDNERDYEPGNVRWATAHQQMKNRRAWKKSQNVNFLGA